MQRDSSNQPYEEIPIPGGAVRVTYIEKGWTGGVCIRVQVRDGDGHLKQGPDIPVGQLGEVLGKAIELAVHASP